MAATHSGGGAGDYEWALAKIPQLEIDLAQAITGLERTQADNQALRDIHTDLVSSYKRLQDQNESLRAQLRREQEERRQVAQEHQQQINVWRGQLEAKARDFEAMQGKMTQPRDLDNIKLQLIEEIEQPFHDRVRELEGRLSAEQRKAADAHRQAELLKVQSVHKEEEAKDEIDQVTRRSRQREQSLERQVQSAEAESRRQADVAAAASQLRLQLQEQQAKTARMQQESEEHQLQSERERAAAADELCHKVEEVASARRRANQLEAQLSQEERRRETSQAEIENLKREKEHFSSQLDQSEARVRVLEQQPREDPSRLQAESAQIRASFATEREQHSRAIRSLEDQHQSSVAACKKAELKARQLEDELAEQEREWKREQEECERRFKDELEVAKVQLKSAEQECDAKSRHWREREKTLSQQVESANARAEVAEDKLHEQVAQSQTEKSAIDRRFRESERKLQELQQSSAAEREQLLKESSQLGERAEVAEKQRDTHKVGEESASAVLRKEEKRNHGMHSEIAVLHQTLDDERARHQKEIDEVQSKTATAEEQRRSQAIQRVGEEHRKQLKKHQAAAKQALQKAARKRQETRAKCQELAKKASQLQHEKATAIRICEENKGAYELRLAELGLAVGAASRGHVSSVVGASEQAALAMRAASPVTASSRNDLRSISDRLERHSEWLRNRHDRPTDIVTMPMMDPQVGASIKPKVAGSADIPLSTNAKVPN